MPKHAAYQFLWNENLQAYLLSGPDSSALLTLVPGHAAPFTWLDTISSFAFCSKNGHWCTLRKEQSQRGGPYWYGYRRHQHKMIKHYVGRSADLTLARLEAVAAALNAPSLPALAPPLSGRSELRDCVLATKLCLPPLPEQFVQRPQVLEQLMRGLQHSLTLVVAPAGYGKTTLVRLWIQQVRQSMLIAWVSLDESDNDASQFWVDVLTALDQVDPAAGLATEALALLHTSLPFSPEAVLRVLLNTIAASARSLLLVLDDYHLITTPLIHQQVTFLLQHLSAHLHLCLLTRSQPPLPLARLRVRGLLNEILTEDLRWHRGEASAFLKDIMGVSLSEQDEAELLARTQGWIAGLQLAALSLQRHHDPTRFVFSFSGRNRHVLAYLTEEVLARQPEEVQRFLVRTSMLKRMCSSLCKAIGAAADQSSGRRLLERLVQDHLFVVALDEQGEWYRYHPLFADVLLHFLHQREEREIASLHRRAAVWYEQAGLLEDAVDHLLAANENQLATDLVEQHARAALQRGAFSMLSRLLNRLPEPFINARPSLSLARGAVLLAYGQWEAATAHLPSIERAPTPVLAQERDAESQHRGSTPPQILPGSRAAFKAGIAAIQGDAATASREAHMALQELSGDDLFTRSAALLSLGLARFLQGDLTEARDVLDEAYLLSRSVRHLQIAVTALSQRAVLSLMQGRLHQAASLYHQILHQTNERWHTPLSALGGVFFALGNLYYEWNDLTQAQWCFEQGSLYAKPGEQVEDQVAGLVLLARIHQAHGQFQHTQRTFQQAQQLLYQHTLPSWSVARFAGMRARCALQQGQVAEAARWAEERDLRADHYTPRWTQYLHDFEYVVLARVLLAQKKLAEAMSLLDQLLAAARTQQRTGSMIEIMALQSLVLHAQDHPSKALDTLMQALTLAAPEGYIRLFLDEGEPMKILLRRLHERYREIQTDVLHSLETLLLTFLDPPAHTGSPHRFLIEPLSQREFEILQLMAQGRSNREIARHLIIEVSTVKTHIHHLFGKLHVHNRLQAVAQAEHYGLLSDPRL